MRAQLVLIGCTSLLSSVVAGATLGLPYKADLTVRTALGWTSSSNGLERRDDQHGNARLPNVTTMNLTSTRENVALDLVHKHNETCLSSPFKGYTFLNATVADITYGAMFEDVKINVADNGYKGKLAQTRKLESIVRNIKKDADDMQTMINVTNTPWQARSYPNNAIKDTQLRYNHEREEFRWRLLSDDEIDSGGASDIDPADGSDSAGEPQDIHTLEAPRSRSALWRILIITVGLAIGEALPRFEHRPNLQHFFQSLPTFLSTVAIIVADWTLLNRINVLEAQVVTLENAARVMRQQAETARRGLTRARERSGRAVQVTGRQIQTGLRGLTTGLGPRRNEEGEIQPGVNTCPTCVRNPEVDQTPFDQGCTDEDEEQPLNPTNTPVNSDDEDNPDGRFDDADEWPEGMRNIIELLNGAIQFPPRDFDDCAGGFGN